MTGWLCNCFGYRCRYVTSLREMAADMLKCDVIFYSYFYLSLGICIFTSISSILVEHLQEPWGSSYPSKTVDLPIFIPSKSHQGLINLSLSKLSIPQMQQRATKAERHAKAKGRPLGALVWCMYISPPSWPIHAFFISFRHVTPFHITALSNIFPSLTRPQKHHSSDSDASPVAAAPA